MTDGQLDAYRASIDNIDAALVHLLAERFKITQAVGRYKADVGLPPADPARESSRSPACGRSPCESGLDPAFTEKFLRFIVDEVILHHQRIAARSDARDVRSARVATEARATSRTAAAWASASAAVSVGPSSTMKEIASVRVAAHVGGDAGVGAAGDALDRQAGQLGVALLSSPSRPSPGDSRNRSWWYHSTSAGLQLGTRSTMACVSGSLAGPVPAYSPSPGAPIGPQPYGKLRLRSTPLALPRCCGGLTVGVHRLDEPEVDAVGHRRRRQPLEDRHAVVLVAVDDTDHEHAACHRACPARRP